MQGSLVFPRTPVVVESSLNNRYDSKPCKNAGYLAAALPIMAAALSILVAVFPFLGEAVMTRVSDPALTGDI